MTRRCLAMLGGMADYDLLDGNLTPTARCKLRWFGSVYVSRVPLALRQEEAMDPVGSVAGRWWHSGGGGVGGGERSLTEGLGAV